MPCCCNACNVDPDVVIVDFCDDSRAQPVSRHTEHPEDAIEAPHSHRRPYPRLISPLVREPEEDVIVAANNCDDRKSNMPCEEELVCFVPDVKHRRRQEKGHGQSSHDSPNPVWQLALFRMCVCLDPKLEVNDGVQDGLDCRYTCDPTVQ